MGIHSVRTEQRHCKAWGSVPTPRPSRDALGSPSCAEVTPSVVRAGCRYGFADLAARLPRRLGRGSARSAGGWWPRLPDHVRPTYFGESSLMAWGLHTTRTGCFGTVGEPRPRSATTDVGIQTKVERAPRTQPKPHQRRIDPCPRDVCTADHRGGHAQARSEAEVGSPRVVAFPGLPRIRTCRIPASGSSRHGIRCATREDSRRRQRVPLQQPSHRRRRESALRAVAQPMPPRTDNTVQEAHHVYQLGGGVCLLHLGRWVSAERSGMVVRGRRRSRAARLSVGRERSGHVESVCDLWMPLPRWVGGVRTPL
jgi:hypothetical protein